MKFKGTYDGLTIDCNDTASYIAFNADWFESKDGWIFQDYEYDNVVEEIERIAWDSDISFRDAAVMWANHELY